MAEKNPEVRNRGIHVRVNDKEYEIISKRSEESRLTNPGFLRELGIGHKPKSKIDLMVLEQLIKLRGDLGKVGGLLKLQISKKDNHLAEQEIYKKIMSNQQEISDIILRFNKSRKK